MNRKFEPVMPGRNRSCRRRRRGCRARSGDERGTADRAEHRPAQHLLAARAVDAADRRRRARRHAAQFHRAVPAAPIMTPLLMFGVMIGSLFVVTRLRNSALGRGRAVRLHVHRRRVPDADPDGRGGRSATAGSSSRLAGGMTAAIFFAMAAIATVTKRDFSFMGKFLFVGADPADRRVAREHVPADPGAVGDDLGDRGADLLARTSCTTCRTSCAAARRTTSWRRWACSSTCTTSSSACSTSCWRSRASATDGSTSR